MRFEFTIQIFPRKVPFYWGASRLSSVTDGGIHSASYAYLTNSSLVDNVTFMQSSSVRLMTTHRWDTRYFAYGEMNLLADLSPTASNGVVATFVWGLDLSGSQAGAGGVGGLLAV